MEEFSRIRLLPPYVFNIIGDLRNLARQAGEDIIDFGMGNPDQPTPQHIVSKLVETATKPTHRYSQSKGIPRLRKAICGWYQNKYDVDLDFETEAIVTIGSKEGLAHLALACTGPQDIILVPNPSYPIHVYGFVLAGADIRHVPIDENPENFLKQLEIAIKHSWPKPKMLVLNFPCNPTTQCVDLPFFEKVVQLCKDNSIWIVQDLAYADIGFEGYKAPSILQVSGAKEIAVEFYSLSKSYNMPGWRVGFCCGNKKLIHALTRVKSYLDYGMFTPIQVAAIEALEGDQTCVSEINNRYYERMIVLVEGLNDLGWEITPPKATMFVWAKIPPIYQHLKSLDFSKKLLKEAKVAVSPGIGFGEYGDNYVRFSLIENRKRIRQALRGIKQMFTKDNYYK